ncbi:hypothetical protein [Botrimarina hoheduenensis]|uniref:Flagellar protein FliL n=1 Tax=Botrimarina hoheduenensis TaxID=2528000 RepID=A0A5C5W6K2_9BACT|nr:hypothetical protein [Botrimarina hoheduenensis]TWT46548.1 hypothetical protein Pla111_16440 [Botrimarina hoheduenensis]
MKAAINSSVASTPRHQPACWLIKLVVSAWLLVGTSAATANPDGTANGTVDAEAPQAGVYGVELGDFYYRDVRPVEGAKIRLSFVLHISVAKEHEPLMKQLLDSRLNRLRSAALIGVRLCLVRDFQEPELLMLRNRMEAQLRRIEPRLPECELLISDYAYMSE